MRWRLAMVTLLTTIAATGAATAAASAQPPEAARQPPRPRISVRVTQAIGMFDKDLLGRLVRLHAGTCQRSGAQGTVMLKLLLSDNPRRRGMRVISAVGSKPLKRCLEAILPAAKWPTGRLDGIDEFTVRVRVSRPWASPR